ncbi:hypothetical protein AB0E27_10720 [Streptomyces sparsogenes]|uniref:hypothetical protein n=1 Tax=Streptomyces sparsogenes TaxID=67365 RepID=UPI0033D044A5
MSSPQVPPPSAGMPPAGLSGVVQAVQGDPACLPRSIKGRIEQAQQGSNVQMMGGWTDEQS